MPILSRRQILVIGAGLIALPSALTLVAVLAGPRRIGFSELYSGYGASGFVFSEKAKALDGAEVEFRGFMAPPLKPDAKFFVLTRYPVSLCPFCNTDAEWPSDIVVVYLSDQQTFAHSSTSILVAGRLEFGAWMDPDTGMVSLVRLRGARWSAIS